MHQHPLPGRQPPLDVRAQLLEDLEQVLVALVALLHVEVLDALLAILLLRLGRELFVHDGEHEVDVIGVVGCDVLGGVGSVGCLFLILGDYEGGGGYMGRDMGMDKCHRKLLYAAIIKREKKEKGGGSNAPAKKQIRQHLIHR